VSRTSSSGNFFCSIASEGVEDSTSRAL
jgi:hypothetical protein